MLLVTSQNGWRPAVFAMALEACKLGGTLRARCCRAAEISPGVLTFKVLASTGLRIVVD